MSTNGMKTSVWGPSAWNFLFCSIAGTYPVTFNRADKDQQRRVKAIISMLTSLKETLPCVYCRESYAGFLKELPIEDYTRSRLSMMKWLYLIHDKVNKKLIAQELECYQRELDALKEQHARRPLSKFAYDKKLAVIKKIKVTKPSPPFQTIVEKFERVRAGCSATSKTCS
jgi:hypothetical protein